MFVPDSLTRNVSGPSGMVSPSAWTVICPPTKPTGMVRSPDAARKSSWLAVWGSVVHGTVMSAVHGRSSVTVSVAGVSPTPPSGVVASPIRTTGSSPGGYSSSSLIVTTPSGSAMVAPAGFERWTVNVSSCSTSVSPKTVTSTCLLVSPGANVRVPEADWKSYVLAVPGTVAQSTVTGSSAALSRLTVRSAGRSLSSASDTDVSLIRSAGTTGSSSSRMVTTPSSSPIVAPPGFARWTVNVSSGSSAWSPTTPTVTCLLVSPGANVTVPLPATKSLASAVPATVDQPTVTWPVDARSM